MVAMLIAFPAFGQNFCAPRGDVIASLERKWGEVIKFRVKSDQGVMVELYYAPTGTWTLLITHPDNTNVLCTVDNGTGGHNPAPVKRLGVRI